MINFEFEILDLHNNVTTPGLMFGGVKIHSEPTEAKYEEIINLLKNNKEVVAVHPNFITPRNIAIGMSPYFYVRLKEASDYDLLREIAEVKNVVIVKENMFLPLWYTLLCTRETSDNTLNIANHFYETGLFASAVPDFLSDGLLCTNDPHFYQLWGLHNTSHPNIDINACDAWNITRGNGVVVAVLDQGIALTHIDLASNISSLSYDTESNTSPSKIYGDHGTHCAGTIGAIKDNNIQIVGVAPECTLISVSNKLDTTLNSRIKLAAGINWAWKNGADIINNSWYSDVQCDAIDEAIDSALIYGRNGKGTVIIFASRNYKDPIIEPTPIVRSYSVAYPANSNSDIIAVGAVAMNGKRANFSFYGPELDVVAPGNNILSTVLNNGVDFRSGTSMAAPHVAGVAALILSINPNLTGQEVRKIIESTAQKVRPDLYNYQTTVNRPNGMWNNQMGYGLVNAYVAVRKTQCNDTLPVVYGTVYQNTTWNYPALAIGTTTIPSGVALTITSLIKCEENAEIIIQPGGKLIIDGGTLTNGCGNQKWRGITVIGDSVNPPPTTNHGCITVKNGGYIANATTGIYAVNGGTIYTDNAHFINNTIAVQIEPVTTAQTGTSANFYSTQFVIDNAYLGNTLDFDAHLKLSGCGAVLVYGCKFFNNATNKSYDFGKNTGIWAFNTPLSVHRLTQNPVFSGFNVAIAANNAGVSPKVSIRRGEFSNNLYGIKLNAVNYAEITRNKFEQSLYPACGLHVFNSTGYIITENEFLNSTAASETTGMFIEKSGIAENMIYKNDFQNLNTGIQAVDQNSSQFYHGPVRYPITGLQFLCNHFTQTEHADILVGYSSVLQPSLDNSVRQDQGSLQQPAGNQFMGRVGTQLQRINLRNCSGYNIAYYHSTAVNEDPSYTGNITKHLLSILSDSPSILDTGGGSGGGLEGALAQYNEWDEEYEYWLAKLIAFEGEDEKEYDFLLDMVSYYSALKDNYFNAIIVAAFNEEQSEDDEEEKEKGDKLGIAGQARNDGSIRSAGGIRNDGEKSPSNFEGVPEGRGSLYETLRFLFGYRNQYTDNLSIIETLVAESNYGEALTTLAKMYIQFEITEEQRLELKSMETYILWLQQLREEGKSIYQLPDNEIKHLVNYVESNSGRGAVFAKNILCGLYGICIEEEVGGRRYEVGGSEGEKEKVHRHSALDAESQGIAGLLNSIQYRNDERESITLYPNPTTGVLNLIQEIVGQARNDIRSIEVFDVYGRKLSSHHLITSSSHQKINISHINSGIYFVKITTEQSEVVKKIVKQ